MELVQPVGFCGFRETPYVTRVAWSSHGCTDSFQIVPHWYAHIASLHLYGLLFKENLTTWVILRDRLNMSANLKIRTYA